MFDAPVEAVFRAWTTPEKLAAWAWGSLGKDVTAEVDLREGGHYRIETAGSDGSRMAFSGTYLEIAPPDRLVYTVTWQAPMGYDSPGELVTVEFSPQGEKTEVVFIHEGVPGTKARAEHVRGWNNTFDLLSKLLE